MNVPWKIARYKDLVPVNVSEESFQKLTFKPHSVQRKLKPASVDKPRLADLYPTLCSGCVLCTVGSDVYLVQRFHFQRFCAEKINSKASKTIEQQREVRIPLTHFLYHCICLNLLVPD